MHQNVSNVRAGATVSGKRVRPKELQLAAVIRCSGGEFKTDRAFQTHDCDQQPFNFDYAAGTNV